MFNDRVCGVSDISSCICDQVDHLFNEIASMGARNWKYGVKISFLEIYNETIRDLLASGDSSALPKYDVKLQKDGSTSISNLEVVDVTAMADVLELLKRAETNRAVAATDLNERYGICVVLCF